MLPQRNNHYDVIIIGAGAAGLMCAIEAGKRQRKVLILDHANKIGKKILMSGGGRCNFTNYNIAPDRYLSGNQHFMKSSLSRYTQWDFIGLVSDYNIPYHEKTLGQLFCDNKAKDIVNMLLAECDKYNVKIKLETKINKTYKQQNCFDVITETTDYSCESLVIATGGLSIPTMGATGFGYRIAKQFGLKVNSQRAGLVPFIFNKEDQQRFADLKGISIFCNVSNDKASFDENILFTHKGLSGPAILQISSYWNSGEAININLSPKIDIQGFLIDKKHSSLKTILKNTLAELFPKNFIATFFGEELLSKRICDLSNEDINQVASKLHSWIIYPQTTEGYRTAEVTLGGVDCDELSSKTLESEKINNLFFIGEVVDITGWLGGYNFQWAWSSGWAAGQVA
ncbi:NAD(P)/FAD-dependent oxidoreductase [Allofrancisella guangzhouensis]|uniref:Membrane protein n=1 Tax=Allofrancisella guangzhouensis TaxID=594679 RepID=A0A0A8E5F6_9GAMM|nr:NAD(P)/FAD-dependent oxidoreductase [Allofrancisella guangzhouensis]AJC49455.1 membrane protein [Allofrancisella guangzhouensis]MBK2026750.1 NAD(P)/FAD-dependent oxidoreductase [Allofrancisella guangzhouensis]MBK2044255.1 NAD(P)/FAD-dependent oxidoreductase [Allofrancisella guangzhouensis]MBK2046170.1 NAD(P)/FAD-dependent oxidoreductase [Allofrancisella guangzhouensis]